MGNNNYLADPLEFLLSTLLGLFVLAVMLRFLLQLTRADFYNPISQFLVKITDPVLLPLRRVIPGYGGVDVAALVLALLVQLLILLLISWMRGISPGILSLLLLSVAELLSLTINIYLFAILIQVVISWVNPGAYNPATNLLFSLTEPLMRPARRMLPPISGIDLSPLVVLVGLQLLKMILIPPLTGGL